MRIPKVDRDFYYWFSMIFSLHDFNASLTANSTSLLITDIRLIPMSCVGLVLVTDTTWWCFWCRSAISSVFPMALSSTFWIVPSAHPWPTISLPNSCHTFCKSSWSWVYYVFTNKFTFPDSLPQWSLWAERADLLLRRHWLSFFIHSQVYRALLGPSRS